MNQTANNTARKPGVDLEAGDALQFLRNFYTITHFEQHPGYTDHQGHYHAARIACAGEQFQITVFDDEDVTILATASR